MSVTRTSTIKCDHPDCTRIISYEPRVDGSTDSITQGWTLGYAGVQDFCPWHRPDLHPTPWTAKNEHGNDHDTLRAADSTYLGMVERQVAQRIVDAVNKAGT